MLATVGVPHFPIIPESIYNLPFTAWWIVYGSLVLLLGTGSSIMHVLAVVRRRKVKAETKAENQPQLQTPDGTAKVPITTNTATTSATGCCSAYKPLLGLMPALLSWVLIVVFLHLQPSILHGHLVPFILYVGLINAYSVGQMIVAHLTKTSFPYQNVLALPLVLGVLDSIAPRYGIWTTSFLVYEGYQAAFVFLTLGLAVGVYGSFVVSSTYYPSSATAFFDLTNAFFYYSSTSSPPSATI